VSGVRCRPGFAEQLALFVLPSCKEWRALRMDGIGPHRLHDKKINVRLPCGHRRSGQHRINSRHPKRHHPRRRRKRSEMDHARAALPVPPRIGLARGLDDLECHEKHPCRQRCAAKTQCAGPFDKVVKRYDALEQGLTAEIAGRKKELSTKLKTGNKSLPDMQKLLVEVGTLKTTRKFVGNYEEKMMPKLATYENNYQQWLTREINLSKEAGLTHDQAQHYERLFVDRRLATNLGKAKVHQKYTPVGRDFYITRFDIAV